MGKKTVRGYIPWCSLKHQYKESCSFLCQLFEEIFKPVAHKCYILACLFTVSPSERWYSWQQDIHYNTNTPDISLWKSWLILQHFWSCNTTPAMCDANRMICVCLPENSSQITNTILIMPAYLESSILGINPDLSNYSNSLPTVWALL